MNIAVVGGRDFKDYQALEQVLFSSVVIEEDTIISGGANGADKLAKEFALENNIPYKEYPADWKAHGKNAGRIRNAEIVAQADYVIAFWDGVSTGTKHTINLAKEKGLQVLIVSYEPIPEA